jgi:hypothetical protein
MENARDLPAERRLARQHRQPCAFDESAGPDDGVVSPEIAGAAVPEGKPRRQHRAVEPARELLVSCEQRVAPDRDRNRLHQAEIRVVFDDRGKLDQGFAGHEAVRVQNQHVIVAGTPAAAPVGHISGLLAGVRGAAVVEDVRAEIFAIPDGLKGRFLVYPDVRVGRIAQDEEVEIALLAELGNRAHRGHGKSEYPRRRLAAVDDKPDPDREQKLRDGSLIESSSPLRHRPSHPDEDRRRLIRNIASG